MDNTKELVKELDKSLSDYYNGELELEAGLYFSQYQTIKKVNYYSNSKYLSGEEDMFGREKPFFNIVNAKVNFSIVATDLDTKDITILSDNEDAFDKSFLLRRELQLWMKDENFGKTLNRLGEIRARYGGVLLKKSKEEGKLKIEVVNWNSVVTDQRDILGGNIIEIHKLKEHEIVKRYKGFNGDVSLHDILKLKDKDGFITLYEMHGIFEDTLIGGNEKEYSNQYHLIAGNEGSKKFVIHSVKENELPYKYLAWREVLDRGLGYGVVEEGFQAQQWVNDARLQERQANEIGSKVVFYSDDNLLQNNILTDVENGTVLKLQQGRNIGMLNSISRNIPEFKNLITEWQNQYSQIASVFETNSGETLPSGTPFRLAAIQTQNANSLFQYRRQELGIFLREVFADWVIPYLVEKLNKEHTLVTDFSEEELKKIDEGFINKTVNEDMINQALQGAIISPEDYQANLNRASDFIGETKQKRFVKIPKDYFKDIKAKVDIITTGEQMNKAVILESLNNILSIVSANPAILENEGLSKIFYRMVEVADAGISPIDLMPSKTQQAQQAQMAQQAQQAQGAKIPEMTTQQTGSQTEAIMEASNPANIK